MHTTLARAAIVALFLAAPHSPALAAGWAVGANGVVLKSSDGGTSWTSTTPATVALASASFLNDNSGWVVGAGGLVMRTTNGGTDWTLNSPTAVNLNDVMFVDQNHGWAVGNSGMVIRTSNGGANWTAASPTPSTLNAVFFVDANRGWAVGNGVVLRTTNGGISWTASAPTTAVLEDVFFVNTTTGYAVGSTGTVLKTTNGGASWTTSKPTTRPLNAVTFVSASVGWAVGESGVVLKSSNGGNTWVEQRPVLTELTAVSFIDATTGWAAGLGGVMIKTEDAGNNWTASNPTSLSLYDVTFKSIPVSVSVTVQTNPPGRSFSVDGTVHAAARTFHWNPGEPHTIATTSPQSGATGYRYVWSNWSNGGAISQTIAPATNLTYTANFTTQHFLTVNSGGNGTVSPSSGWQDAATNVTISATPDPGYGFNGWTGTGSGSYSGSANPTTVAMNAPITETAVFGTSISVTVQSIPTGRVLAVDGNAFSGSQTFTWAPVSLHTIEATSPQDAGTDARYVFRNWSDGGAATHTISPNGTSTFTATFRAQYVLTVQSGPGGTAGPSTGWMDAGASVTVTASADSGYSFESWSGTGLGSYTGTRNPATVTVNGPITQQANFREGTSTLPAALTLLPNAPNPFANETEVRFGLSHASDVAIDVFDVAGRRVRSDLLRNVPSGWGSYQFDAVTDSGVRLGSGVYFVRLTAAGTARTTKLVVIR